MGYFADKRGKPVTPPAGLDGLATPDEGWREPRTPQERRTAAEISGKPLALEDDEPVPVKRTRSTFNQVLGSVIGAIPGTQELVNDTTPLERLPGNIAKSTAAQAKGFGAGAVEVLSDIQAKRLEMEVKQLREQAKRERESPGFFSTPEYIQRLDDKANELEQRLLFNENASGKASRIGRRAQIEQEQAIPADAGPVEQAVQQGVSSAAISLPAVMGAGPVGGAALLGFGSGASRYSQLKAAGVPEDEAAKSGALLGSLEGLTEFIPSKSLLKNAGPFWKKAAEFLVTDLAGENITSVAQLADDYRLGLRDDVTGEDFKQAIIDTSAATVAGAGFQLGAVELLQAATRRANELAESRAPQFKTEINPADFEPKIPLQIEGPKPKADFEVNPQGVARAPGQELPALPSPAAASPPSGQYAAGNEGVRELGQAEARTQATAREQLAMQQDELGTSPVRVPAPESLAPAPKVTKAAKPENFFAAKRRAKQERVETLKDAISEVVDPKEITLKPDGDQFTIMVRDKPAATYPNKSMAEDELAEIRKEAAAQRSGEIVEKPVPIVKRALESVGGQGKLPADADITASDTKTVVLGQTVDKPATPTPAQIEAGNYRKPLVQWKGLDIKVENEAGSTRSGKDAGGKEWSRLQESAYGYFPGTKSNDGEGVDVYIGPKKTSGTAFVIDQLTPDGSKHDEPKALVGFATEQEARAAYLKNYPKGWKGLGAITAMPVEELKTWLKTGDTKTPVSWKRPAEKPQAPAQKPAKQKKQETPEVSTFESRMAKLQEEMAAEKEAAEQVKRAPADAIAGEYSHAKHGDAKATVTKIDKGYKVDFGGGDVQELKGPTAAKKMTELLAKEGFSKKEEAPLFAEKNPAGWEQADPGESVTEQHVRGEVERILSGIKIKPKLVVSKDVQSLPADLLGAIKRRRADPNSVRAVYWKDTIYFPASQFQTLDQVRQAVLHETVIHHGIKALLDEETRSDLLEGIAADNKMEVIRRGVKEFGKTVRDGTGQVTGGFDPGNPVHRQLAAEEMLAYYGQKYLNSESLPARIKRWVEKWFGAIRDGLRRMMGKDQKFDTTFMKKLLQDLQEGLRTGEPLDVEETDVTDEAMAQSIEPTFYSALTRAAENAKITKGPALQWMATLRNTPGVKQEELDWSGISDWLSSLGRTANKDEVVEYLRANEIEVKDVVYSEPEPNLDSKYALPEVLKAAGEVSGAAEEELVLNIANDGAAYRALTKKFPELIEDADWASTVVEDIFGQTNVDTKFKQYTLPGGSKYRELLLTLPSKSGLPDGWRVRRDGDSSFAVEDENGKTVSQWQPTEAEAIKLAINEDGRVRADSRKQQYRSSHWDEPNILAHVRFDERTDADGKRVLHIGEVQSDWHQAGRKSGYSTAKSINDENARREVVRKDATDRLEALQNPRSLEPKLQSALAKLGRQEWVGHYASALEKELPKENPLSAGAVATKKEMESLVIERAELTEVIRRNQAVSSIGTPDAPFKTTWPELAMKRMIRWGAQNGFDRITWDTGETNAERYDLSKQLDSVQVRKSGNDGPYSIIGRLDNRDVFVKHGLAPNELDDLVGKDLADKARTQETASHVYTGVDLMVGGEGMIGFYDKILPATVNKMVKKWGGRVSSSSVENTKGTGRKMTARDGRELAIQDEPPIPVHALDITPAMRDAAIEGLPMFSMRDGMSYETDKNTGSNRPTEEQLKRRKIEIEKGGGTYNISVDNLSEKEIETLEGAFEDLDNDIADQRRGKRPWSATERSALDMLSNNFGLTLDGLVNRKIGSAANAEALEAYGSLLASATRQLSKLAEKASQTNANDDLLNLMMARERMGLLLAPAMGYRSEAGRALNILKKTAVDFAEADKLFEEMGDGSREAITDFAKRVKSVGTVDQIIGLVRASYTPTLWDKFYEYWINGILSGPKTHAVNVVSNAMMAGLEFSAHAIAAATSSHVSLNEIKARSSAAVHGTIIGLSNAKGAFLTEEPQGDASSKLEAPRKAIKGRIGKFVRIPGRLLMSEDEFFKSVSYHQELAGLAMREAVQKNPKSPKAEFDKIMGDLLNRRDLIEQARAKARVDTFQTPMGPITAAVARALDQSKVGRLIVPFLRTPTNILKTVAEYTPAAPLLGRVRASYKAGGADWAVAKGRITIGSGFALSAIGLTMAGLMSGAGPDDDRERKILETMGWQPYSVKLGDRWYKYNRFDPLGTILGITADMVETSEYLSDDELGKAGAMIAASIAMNLGDKSYLKGISDFSQAYSDPSRYMQNYAKDMATSLIPNVIAQTAREIDPYERQARSLIDTARSKIPLAREQLPKRVNLFGKEIKSTNFGWFVPLSVREQTPDPVAAAMLRLGVNKQMPQRRIRGIELGADQYIDYAKYVGESAYLETAKAVDDPDFKSLMDSDPEAARSDLESAWDSAANQARESWLYDHPDIDQKIEEKKGESKAIGSKYLDDLTSRVAPLIDGKDRLATVRALKDAGHPALAALFQDLPAKPRPIVANALRNEASA